MHGMCTNKFSLTRVLETLIDSWLIQRSNQVIHYCIPSTGSCLSSSFMAQQPLVGQDLLIIEASRSHSDTPHSVGPLWASDQRQRPLSDKTQYSQERGIHGPGGILTHNPKNRVGADSRLRRCGHWDLRSLSLGR